MLSARMGLWRNHESIGGYSPVGEAQATRPVTVTAEPPWWAGVEGCFARDPLHQESHSRHVMAPLQSACQQEADYL